jgi:DNA-binding transcriptional LysR family regulator
MTVPRNQMTLSGRMIEAFLALERTRRFSDAAEQCNLSPSAFSQMISRLEESLGVRLFDRDTRHVTMTPEGEVFATGARRIAAEISATLSELQQRASLSMGRVAIAAPPSLASDWLPNLLASYRVDYPGISLRLHDVVSDQCLEMISQGDVDFGLNARQGDREFESELLFHERFYVICQASDPIAAKSEVNLSDLKNRDFIHTLRSGSVWQQMSPMLGSAGIRDSGFEVNQFGTVAGLVASGFGVSIVPHLAVSLCERHDLAAVPISSKNAVRPIYLVKRRGRTLSAAADQMYGRIFAASELVRKSMRPAKGAT